MSAEWRLISDKMVSEGEYQ